MKQLVKNIMKYFTYCHNRSDMMVQFIYLMVYVLAAVFSYTVNCIALGMRLLQPVVASGCTISLCSPGLIPVNESGEEPTVYIRGNQLARKKLLRPIDRD